MSDCPEKLREVVEKLKKGELSHVVTMAGAGISTSAGVPDFRSPTSGLFHRLAKYNLPSPELVFDATYFKENPEPFFDVLKDGIEGDYKPTKAHAFVKLLETKGRLLTHFTQNVDGLERQSGLAKDKLIEVHGTLVESHCSQCKHPYDFPWLKNAVKSSSVPKCDDCGGVVKPDVILYGESLSKNTIRSLKQDLNKCDLLIIMGTSLVVQPSAAMVTTVKRFVRRIVINDVPVGENVGIDFNTDRDTLIQGSCDRGVSQLCDWCGWSSELETIHSQISQ